MREFSAHDTPQIVVALSRKPIRQSMPVILLLASGWHPMARNARRHPGGTNVAFHFAWANIER